MIGSDSLDDWVRKRTSSSCTSAASGAPFSLKSGTRSRSADGSSTAPDSMCAPASRAFSRTAICRGGPSGPPTAACWSCERRSAAESPAGPPPTMRTSTSNVSRLVDVFCSTLFSDGHQRTTLFAVRVVDRPALVVEHHRRASGGIEGGPFGEQALDVRIAGPREAGPGGAHAVLQRVAVLASAGHCRGEIDVLEDERNVERVIRLQLAVVHRRAPREVIHVDGRRLRLGLAPGNGQDAAADGVVG